MLLDLQLLTTFHTAISLLALPLGTLAVCALFGVVPRFWINAFLIITAAVVITGFFFPLPTLTPAVVTGFVASFVLAAVLLARYVGKYKGLWRPVYAGGVVVCAYLMVFVTVAQIFIKTPILGQGLGFGVTQLAVLGLFIFLGIKAARAFRA